MIQRTQLLCIEHLNDKRQNVEGCSACKEKHRRAIDDDIKIIKDDIKYIDEEIKKLKERR